MIKVLVVIGTRPEAVKLCPVVQHLRGRPKQFEVRVCVTAQHRALLDQVLAAFGTVPDRDLDVMVPAQSLAQSTSRIIATLDPVLRSEQPDLVLVQGDTTTTLCGALAAFYQGVPAGHVEAGIRTRDFTQPFPEEMNRVLVSRLATFHFAPTALAARNLQREGVPPQRIAVTGNPGVDAVLTVRDGLAQGRLRVSGWPQLDPTRRLILVTAHRRESFGAGLERICDALERLAARDDVQIVYPVHPNPRVLDPVLARLGHCRNVLLAAPVDYVPFVDLMRRAYLLITDSGGIQEEAPALGKPLVVTREKTERPEAVEGGTAVLAGTDAERIVGECQILLEDPKEYARRSRVHNFYGDGRASSRIADAIHSFFEERRRKSGVRKLLPPAHKATATADMADIMGRDPWSTEPNPHPLPDE